MSLDNHISDHYVHAIKSNEQWACFQKLQKPTFFQKADTGQSPAILWLGCSDSRVPETTILGLEPGEVFVHRNIANIISPTDINSMAVIEYAVQHLKVKHIILCGHTRCGGAMAALSDTRVGGVLDTWISPLVMLRRDRQEIFDAMKDEKQKAVRLAELGVEMGVRNILNNYCVIEAMEERGLRVHGCLFDIATGKIRELC